MESREGGPSGTHVVGGFAALVGLAGVACGITLLYLGMRSVMDVGGACASGNVPYQIRQPCPGGVTGLILGGIWGGLIFAGVYAWQAWRLHIPNLTAFFWPALFLSLGWNFLDYGLDGPGSAGLVWGWLVCAVLFFLMGAIPLIVVLPAFVRHLRGTDESSPAWHAGLPTPATLRSTAYAMRNIRPEWIGTPASTPSSSPTGDVVSELERLETLHRSGALDDAEYAAAKRRILEQT